jgi:enamine deaminase RidA (YjgF/YER057c/UK114 family)
LSHPQLPDPVGFSRAVRAGDGQVVHLAGQVALGADGQVIGDADVEAQAAACMERIVSILAAASGTSDDLVSLLIHATRPDDLPRIRNVVDRYLTGPVPPAMTGVAVVGLSDPRMLVEISGVAVLPDHGHTSRQEGT